LLEEFSQSFQNAYIFSGLAPTPETTEKSQRKEFIRQYERCFNCPPEKTEDWGDLFWQLALKVSAGEQHNSNNELNNSISCVFMSIING
jgi:hypothetical protein